MSHTSSTTARSSARRRGERPRAGAWRLLAALLAGLLLLAGCGSGDDDSGGDSAASEDSGAGGEESGDVGVGDVDGGGVGEVEGDDADSAGDDGDDVPIADLAAGPTAGRSVIRNARLSVEADDTVALVASVRQRVVALGGFVGAEELRSTPDGLVGTMTVRVPGEQLDTALEEIDGLGSVTQRSLDSEDVTDQLTDLDARIANLRALETELTALLADTRERTADASEVLAVFQQVNDVRLQVEVLDAQQAALRERVGLATIVLDVMPTADAALLAVDEDGWSPGSTLSTAVGTTLVLGQALVDLTIWLVVVAGPFLLLLLAGWVLLRRVLAATGRTPRGEVAGPRQTQPDDPVSV